MIKTNLTIAEDKVLSYNNNKVTMPQLLESDNASYNMCRKDIEEYYKGDVSGEMIVKQKTFNNDETVDISFETTSEDILLLFEKIGGVSALKTMCGVFK